MVFIYRKLLMVSDGYLTRPTGFAVSDLAGGHRIVYGLHLGLQLNICWNEKCFESVLQQEAKYIFCLV
jgi:hypothetical protein